MAANTLSDVQDGGGLQPPPYLSPSSIETFKQCPLKFKYSRIDRLRDPPTEATTKGSFVHAVLEDLYALPPADRTLASAKVLMSAQWKNEWEEKTLDVIGADPDKLRSFRWNSWWCIENCFKLEDPTKINPDGIERELNSTISDVPIKGFIDRWQMGKTGIIISDYKTGKTPQPKYRNSKFFQLLIYADILAAELDAPIERVELLYLKDPVRLKLDSGTKMLEDVASMRVVVKETYDGVLKRCSAGEFEPTKNTLCDWCSYKSFCPAWKK